MLSRSDEAALEVPLELLPAAADSSASESSRASSPSVASSFAPASAGSIGAAAMGIGHGTGGEPGEAAPSPDPRARGGPRSSPRPSAREHRSRSGPGSALRGGGGRSPRGRRRRCGRKPGATSVASMLLEPLREVDRHAVAVLDRDRRRPRRGRATGAIRRAPASSRRPPSGVSPRPSPSICASIRRRSPTRHRFATAICWRAISSAALSFASAKKRSPSQRLHRALDAVAARGPRRSRARGTTCRAS